MVAPERASEGASAPARRRAGPGRAGPGRASRGARPSSARERVGAGAPGRACSCGEARRGEATRGEAKLGEGRGAARGGVCPPPRSAHPRRRLSPGGRGTSEETSRVRASRSAGGHGRAREELGIAAAAGGIGLTGTPPPALPPTPPSRGRSQPPRTWRRGRGRQARESQGAPSASGIRNGASKCPEFRAEPTPPPPSVAHSKWHSSCPAPGPASRRSGPGSCLSTSVPHWLRRPPLPGVSLAPEYEGEGR
ncbi:collagen alpha-1(III) chain-like [Suncus etruscus]|uniref:collagen alpha-1(III) chain-like n=1 Tax=Suncus etruscus TaxID=109475 RepID=UPI002110C195|nr:collagen alpha-1(III) chain-like [Suncus etruscus]